MKSEPLGPGHRAVSISTKIFMGCDLIGNIFHGVDLHPQSINSFHVDSLQKPVTEIKCNRLSLTTCNTVVSNSYIQTTETIYLK